MRIVGLTGGIACGKSTVTEMLREEHILVIDCDLIAARVTQKVWRRLHLIVIWCAIAVNGTYSLLKELFFLGSVGSDIRILMRLMDSIWFE